MGDQQVYWVYYKIQNSAENKRSMKSVIILISLSILVLQSQQIDVDPNDVLNGEGLFLGSSIAAFSLDNTHTVSFIPWNGSNVLKLVKPTGEEVSYKKGLTYSFSSTKPKHIQFKFASTSPDTQDTNLRVIDSSDKTLVLFRAGRGGLIRVNQKQMISFYNSSVSVDSDIKLTQVDLLLYWQQKRVQIFINNQFKDACQFFDKDIVAVNKVLLYNLYSSTSYWVDLVICGDICYAFNWDSNLYVGMASIIGLILCLSF